MTMPPPEVQALANVGVSVTMAATVRTTGDMVYASGSSYTVSPATAYRWQVQGLITTGTATTIGTTTAPTPKARSVSIVLGGTFLSQPSDWWVEYGKTTSYGQRSSVGPNTVTNGVTDSIQLNALTPATVYHYRVVAVGAGGRVNQADQTFTTAAAPANP